MKINIVEKLRKELENLPIDTEARWKSGSVNRTPLSALVS